MAVPAYRRLFFSAAIVIFGVMGQAVARGWLARDISGSNAGLGGVMLAFGTAMLIATPFGGVAADRYPKRTVVFVTVLALAVSSVSVGAAVVTDNIEYWMLLVASAVQAAAFAFYLPARIAFIAEVVGAADLSNAIVIAQMASEAGRVIAPALAGVLLGVSWFGVGGVFLAAGAASAASLVFIVGLPPGASPERVERSAVAEVADAVKYAHATPGLGAAALFTVGIVMVGFPYLTFLPTLADDRYHTGAIGFGVMSAVAGAGALAAGLVSARRHGGTRPRMTLAGAAGTLGLSLMALAVAPSYGASLVVLAAIGGAGLVFQTSSQALMLRLSTFEYHGRIQSIIILGFSGFGLAALPLGLLADATSAGLTLIGMGMVTLAMTTYYAAVCWRGRHQPAAIEFG